MLLNRSLPRMRVARTTSSPGHPQKATQRLFILEDISHPFKKIIDHGHLL
jgi:hypothetical protein